MAFNNYYQNPYAMSYGTNYATPNYTNQPTMMQQPQPQPQPVPQANMPVIYGKVVDCLETAKAVDVPIGTSYILPKADGSSVFAKGWNVDGTTYVKEYQLVDQKVDEIPSIDWNEKLDDIYDSIDSLNKKIDKIKPATTTTTKKRRVEVDEDDA